MATHTNIGAMLGDLHAWIQAHPGCEVFSSDSIGRREWGFHVFGDDTEDGTPFSISVAVVRSQCSAELWSYMGTAAGRQALAKILVNPIPPKPPEERPEYPTAWEHLLAEDPV